jgi:hypothetical protein
MINAASFLENMMQDRDMAIATAEAYFAGADDLMAKLKSAVISKDFPALKKTIHALKGSASVFGDTPYLEHLKKLDQLSKAADFEQVLKQINQLYDFSQKFDESLRLFIKGSAQ